VTETLAWFNGHPPDGLFKMGEGSSSTPSTSASGYSYSAPDSSAWVDAEVAVTVTQIGVNMSAVRGDGIAVWIDPVPYGDNTLGPRMRLTVAGGCPATDQGYVGVTNPQPALNSSLVPPSAPTEGLVCEFYGGSGHPFALKKTTVLDGTAAAAFAVKARELRLGHVDGEVLSCPNDDGSVTAVALAYPGGSPVDLWMTGGCAGTSNGYIRVDGSVSV
jgi:hypothetical protein